MNTTVLKTIELAKASNLQLNWLVAKAQGWEPDTEGGYHEDVGRVVIYKLHGEAGPGRYPADTEWNPVEKADQLYQLMREELIQVAPRMEDGEFAGRWEAFNNRRGGYWHYGDTPLVAIARACIAARLGGKEVNVPEELT